jgi:hypothetical protein
VYGGGFKETNSSYCRFGDQITPATFIDYYSVQCSSPKAVTPEAIFYFSPDGKTWVPDQPSILFFYYSQ